MNPSRRDLLLAPLAAALSTVLGGCAGDRESADGMVAFVWDRDRCSRCGMAIGDRRFAAQLRGGPKREAFKFDDIGCAASWCSDKHRIFPWANDPATRWWVADFEAPGERWLDARSAHYAAGPRSPMGYDFAAYAQPRAGGLAFEAMAAKASSTWPADCGRPRAASAPTT